MQPRRCIGEVCSDEARPEWNGDGQRLVRSWSVGPCDVNLCRHFCTYVQDRTLFRAAPMHKPAQARSSAR